MAIGGNVMDAVNASASYGAGSRAAFLLAVTFYVLGATLLVPVDARRRDDAPAGAPIPEAVVPSG